MRVRTAIKPFRSPSTEKLKYGHTEVPLMARRKTSISFDEDLWKEVKHHCIDANIEPSEYLERLAPKDLRK